MVGSSCGIPHGNIITLGDHVLNRRPQVRKCQSDGLHELSKAFRTIFLVGDLLVTPVHKISRENLGGHFEVPAIEHFLDNLSNKRLVMVKPCSVGHWCSPHGQIPDRWNHLVPAALVPASPQAKYFFSGSQYSLCHPPLASSPLR